MKKKITAIILTAVLIASVSSCGGGGGTSPATTAGEKNAADAYAGETAPVTTVAPAFAADYDSAEYAYADDYDGSVSDSSYDGGYMGFNKEKQRAGLLTGGEWRDNSNFVFWKKLFEQRTDWAEAEKEWKLTTRERIFVRVNDANGAAAAGMTVKLAESGSKTIIWETVTDSRGEAFLFTGLDIDKSNALKADEVIVEAADGRAVITELTDEMKSSDAAIEVSVPESSPMRTELDLMLMVDTTGSMGDELKYLQTELGDVIKRVENATGADVQLSVNFYRDRSDDYVVRDYGFTKNISIALDHLNDQRSSGGGDYPEAVTAALDNGINGHQWRNMSEKIMLLVLDAPPHKDDALQSLKPLIQQAAKLGIRIIPVASSGVDTDTEFLCRCMAMATGGTYTFLTDDSGIGNSHLEPTVGSYTVEKLNDMLVRLISDYFSQEARSYAEPYDDGQNEEMEAVNGSTGGANDNEKKWYPASHEKSHVYFEDGLYTEGLIKTDAEFAEFYQKYLADDMLDGLYSQDIDFSKNVVAYKVEMLTSGSITVDDSKGVYCALDGDKPVFRYMLNRPEVGTTDIMTLFVYSVIPTDGSGTSAVTTAALTTAAPVTTPIDDDEWLDRMEKVDNDIEAFMSETVDLPVKERANAVVSLLNSLADSGLVVRESILYDGDDMVSFAYDIGGGETVLGGIQLKDFDPLMN